MKRIILALVITLCPLGGMAFGIDISGTWYGSTNEVGCGAVGSDSLTIVITQNGQNVTMQAADSTDTVTGTLNGTTLTVNPFSETDDGQTLSVTNFTVMFSEDAKFGSLSHLWTRTGNNQTCQGATTGIIAKQGAVNPSASDVQLLGLSTGMTVPPKVGEQVSLVAPSANLGQGDVYYYFWYRAGFGTPAYDSNPWISIRGWDIDNATTVSFPSAGRYIVVVWAAKDPNTATDKDVHIVGMDITVVNQ